MKLSNCPNCQSDNLSDISELYKGWEEGYSGVFRCLYCGKLWGDKNGEWIDLTEAGEKASGDALDKAINIFLSGEMENDRT